VEKTGRRSEHMWSHGGKGDGRGEPVCGHQVHSHRFTCAFIPCNHFAVLQVRGSIAERVFLGQIRIAPKIPVENV
jgi:hypothetical protein